MPDTTLKDRAQELVRLYRALARNLEQEDAARLSSAIGHMLMEVERAQRAESSVAHRLAEDALADVRSALHSLEPGD